MIRLPIERWPEVRRRVGGLALALFFESLLVLLLLTLGQSVPKGKSADEALTSFTMEPDRADREKPTKPQRDRAATVQAVTQQPPRPVPPSAARPVPTPLPPPLIALPRDQMALADIARRPTAAPRQSPIGPPNTPMPGDSQPLAATGPHGEPLYPAAWYREPYDDELRGYLSTADGPGWALINCKTVPDFRVDDCVLVDEYPTGSNIGRSVLAAAWQFRVRPPRIGGVSKVGEWVRIRIDYELRRR
jgi:protein TonB